jgi:glycine hydroxymethyltransferase
MIMTSEGYAKAVDKSVFPGLQGGPLMHVIAGKAVAFREALTPEFTIYSQAVIDNAQHMAAVFAQRGLPAISGGTDTHLMLLNVDAIGLSGKKAERLLDEVGITVNKNTIPADRRPPTQASGIRIGTPAVTTRGFGIAECEAVAELIADVLTQPEDLGVAAAAAERVRELAEGFPLPGLGRGLL